MGKVDALITPHPLYNALSQIKEARPATYKKLFEGRLHEKVIKEFNDSAEKGDVLGNKNFGERIEGLIGRVLIKGSHGGDRKSERFKNQQL